MDPGQPLSLRPKGLVEDIGELMDKIDVQNRKQNLLFFHISKYSWLQPISKDHIMFKFWHLIKNFLLLI